MTFPDRASALTAVGFTERQAGFLVHVMLHAGVCLRRQYCAYAGIVRGQKMVDFFRRLVDERLATPHACGYSKAQFYHVHNARLYRLIEQPDVRFRKPSSLGRAIERLMVLDHVIGHPAFTWLGTEDDKVAHFLGLPTPIRRDLMPRLVFRSGTDTTTRYFPDKYPIGVPKDSRRHVLVYVATDPTARDFRAFLRRHAELLRALPQWSIRVVVPSAMAERWPRYERAFRDELATGLSARVGDELRWYYRLSAERIAPDLDRVKRARRAFAAPRFHALRRAWDIDGDRAIDVAVSTLLGEAIERGEGCLERQDLTRQYLHLSPLVGSS